ncbi:hypothetical protein FAF44_03240 [Nonomuraea sp. MG754425]|uniref:hypothetical protein n=1 Tax=Nonomuraea sp. MG754425 TaxID=2570319 RepID=UPI001F3AA252|nr:hypothetical protein [Nonomuraea sp. MG754425]MCF6467429.1 hypothetical protein [Nonomuraea sp. MG754425]
MEWYNVLAAVFLGAGLALGRFRRKDKSKNFQPRTKIAYAAAGAMLLGGLCGMLTPIGGWSASLGDWLAEGIVIAAICVIAAAAMIVIGVVLDWQDGIPDKRTLVACIVAPQIAMIALGAIFGASVYDDMVDTANVTQESVVSAQVDR